MDAAGARLPPALASAALLALGGCGQGAAPLDTTPGLRPDQLPVPIGRGPAYRLPAISAAVNRRAPVHGMSCERRGAGGGVFAVHLELFARRLVLPVPAGIGIAPPQRRRGAYVIGGACEYPVRTHEPTGLVVVARGAPRRTLADLFAVWGTPLSADELAGFRGRVEAFVDGRRWPGDPRSIPLERHAELVLEIDGFVPPHPAYRFPAGV